VSLLNCLKFCYYFAITFEKFSIANNDLPLIYFWPSWKVWSVRNIRGLGAYSGPTDPQSSLQLYSLRI